MNPRLLFVASLAITTLTFAELSIAQNAIPRSSESILGAWLGSDAISAGKVAKWNHDVLIEKDRIIFKRRGSDTNGETWDYTIDATKKPKQITMVRSAGLPDIETGKPQRLSAVIEQSEKEIRIAFLPGRNGSSLEERPIDLTSTKENQAIVLVLVPETVEDAQSRRTKR
jgi:hypothetical protein